MVGLQCVLPKGRPHELRTTIRVSLIISDLNDSCAQETRKTSRACPGGVFSFSISAMKTCLPLPAMDDEVIRQVAGGIQ